MHDAKANKPGSEVSCMNAVYFDIVSVVAINHQAGKEHLLLPRISLFPWSCAMAMVRLGMHMLNLFCGWNG